MIRNYTLIYYKFWRVAVSYHAIVGVLNIWSRTLIMEDGTREIVSEFLGEVLIHQTYV